MELITTLFGPGEVVSALQISITRGPPTGTADDDAGQLEFHVLVRRLLAMDVSIAQDGGAVAVAPARDSRTHRHSAGVRDASEFR
jgi:hypothetical protein